MITLTGFNFTFPIHEKDAKQFARDLAVLLDGAVEAVSLPNKIVVRRFGPDAFKSKWVQYAGWVEPTDELDRDLWSFKKAKLTDYDSAGVAAEALKFANASLDPQAKVVAALTKHLRQADALF